MADQWREVEQRFPEDGNRKLRRAALEKVLQYFPDDRQTQFTAETSLAELDWKEEKLTAAIGRLQRLLNSEASDAVDSEERAWAEYLLSFCLRDDGKEDKAARLLKDIAEDGGVMPPRASMSPRNFSVKPKTTCSGRLSRRSEARYMPQMVPERPATAAPPQKP